MHSRVLNKFLMVVDSRLDSASPDSESPDANLRPLQPLQSLEVLGQRWDGARAHAQSWNEPIFLVLDSHELEVYFCLLLPGTRTRTLLRRSCPMHVVFTLFVMLRNGKRTQMIKFSVMHVSSRSTSDHVLFFFEFGMTVAFFLTEGAIWIVTIELCVGNIMMVQRKRVIEIQAFFFSELTPKIS